jgi:AraC-like DNA-binding protein
MWNDLASDPERNWHRQWFGLEFAPEAAFNVRVIGIREPLFNRDVHWPAGTGDWLVMLFHEPTRLDPDNPEPSHPVMSLVIWPPGAAQFYSWGNEVGTEAHSWMHIEGTVVKRQIEAMELPTATPFPVPDASVMDGVLESLLAEMRLGRTTDSVILQNLFENWTRGIRRQVRPAAFPAAVPPGLLRVQRHLDVDFRRIPPLDELARLAAMSRSHLCHQFRRCFGSSISEYVIRKRMAAAQRLLYEIHLRSGEIAEAVGYADIYEFSKQFKKTFGVSPMRYRKSQVHS